MITGPTSEVGGQGRKLIKSVILVIRMLQHINKKSSGTIEATETVKAIKPIEATYAQVLQTKSFEVIY